MHVLGQLEAEVELLHLQLVEGRLHNHMTLDPGHVLRIQSLESFGGLLLKSAAKYYYMEVLLTEYDPQVVVMPAVWVGGYFE